MPLLWGEQQSFKPRLPGCADELAGRDELAATAVVVDTARGGFGDCGRLGRLRALPAALIVTLSWNTPPEPRSYFDGAHSPQFHSGTERPVPSLSG